MTPVHRPLTPILQALKQWCDPTAACVGVLSAQQRALQVNVEALPDGPQNPYGNGFIPVETDLTSELKAQRVCDPMKARLWKIKNPGSVHPVTGVAGPSGDQPGRPLQAACGNLCCSGVSCSPHTALLGYAPQRLDP